MEEVPTSQAKMDETSSSPSDEQQQTRQEKASWHSYVSEDLPRTFLQSTDSAKRSARSLQHNSSSHLCTLQEFIPQIRSWYKTYEDAFFKKVKDELAGAREHTSVAVGISVTAGLLIMRGPRRFLFHHTLGRLRNEEAQFVRAEKNVKDLTLSVDSMKKESGKLLERASLAEKDMKRGLTELMDSGSQIQGLAKLICKSDAEAAALMDVLREIPGRKALKLRAEVASMSSILRQQRTAMDKTVMKISDFGIPV